MSKILKKFEGFTIWSGDYKKLAKWYEEKFDLEVAMEIDIPNDNVIAFKIEEGSDMYLWIGQHSEVEGKSKDPYRTMISFFVEDIFNVAKELEEKGVEIIAGPDEYPDGGLYFLTARDP